MQSSTLVLPVAQDRVKHYVDLVFGVHTNASADALALRWRTYGRFCGAVRKFLTGTCLGKTRRSFCLWLTQVKPYVGLFLVYTQMLPKKLWHYAGRHISAPMGQCGNCRLALILLVDQVRPYVGLILVYTQTPDALPLRWPTYQRSYETMRKLLTGTCLGKTRR